MIEKAHTQWVGSSANERVLGPTGRIVSEARSIASISCWFRAVDGLGARLGLGLKRFKKAGVRVSAVSTVGGRDTSLSGCDSTVIARAT
jgi:hypothetical protein